ncbi:MAG: hypothetical protein AAGL89_01035 [Pseudomonadota bacterium]
MSGLKKKMKLAAQRTALGGLSGLLLVVGTAFLTAAAYLYLREVADALFALTVIGGAYFGLGLIFLAIASAKGEEEDDEDAPQPRDVGPADVVEAFFDGVSRGKRAAAR